MIDVERQQSLLINVARKLKKPIIVYAIGGTAMMFQGFKEATLDIDLVFENHEDREVFKKAIQEIGYKKMDSVLVYGSKDNHPEMFTLGDERFDLFVGKIIYFDFSKQMQNRAGDTHEFSDNLILKVAEPLDIILLKCATDRVKDKDDVRRIIENTKIDWNILIEEAKNQIKLEHEMAAFELGEFLEHLKYKMNVDIPKKVLDELFNIVEKQAEEKQN